MSIVHHTFTVTFCWLMFLLTDFNDRFYLKWVQCGVEDVVIQASGPDLSRCLNLFVCVFTKQPWKFGGPLWILWSFLFFYNALFPVYRKWTHTGAMTNSFPAHCSRPDQCSLSVLKSHFLPLYSTFERWRQFRLWLFPLLLLIFTGSLSLCLLAADWHVCTGDRGAEEGDGPDLSDHGQGAHGAAGVMLYFIHFSCFRQNFPQPDSSKMVPDNIWY